MALLVEATKLELRKKKVRGRERGTRLVRFFFFTPDPPSPPLGPLSLVPREREVANRSYATRGEQQMLAVPRASLRMRPC